MDRSGKRTHIVKAACEEFAAKGYAATSMSGILARAGGSKATLYRYFPSKEGLFCEALDDLLGSLVDGMVLPEPDGDNFEQAVHDICRALTAAITSPPFVALGRLVVAEAARFPEIGRAYRERVVDPLCGRIAGFLRVAMERGLIREADPDTAAAQLIALCRGGTYILALIDPARGTCPADLSIGADEAAKTFLAAFNPRMTTCPSTP